MANEEYLELEARTKKFLKRRVRNDDESTSGIYTIFTADERVGICKFLQEITPPPPLNG